MPRFNSGLLFLPLFLGTIAFGCKDDSSGPDGGGGQGGEGGYGGNGSSVTSVKRTIGKSGGRLQTSNVSLFIPSGALTKDSTITVTELDSAAIEALPGTTDGIKMSGIPAKFEPHGLSFAQPADVILGYNEPTNKSEPLAVLKLDSDEDNTWEYVPGAKFESGSASFEVDGFSIYCVFRDPNGVADMVYGPGEAGTGGTTGSGGKEGSGGDGSGGSGGGGTGGQGGSGGDVNLPGYLDSEFRGFGDTDVGPGVVIEVTDLDSEPGPNCIEGTTGVDPNSFASLTYYVNQDPDGTQQGPLLLSGAGVRLDLTFTTYRQRMVELRGESTTWCARFANEVDGPVFLAWSEFDSFECESPTGGGGPFDPETDAIEQVAVTVLSNQSADAPFELCLEELTTGLPNGYMNGPTWMGYGFVTYMGPAPDDDLYEVEAPNCIEGTTDETLSSFAELGYSLNQDLSYQDLGDVLVGGSGLALDLTVDPERALEFHMWSETTEYCSGLHFAVPSGLLEVPWTEFVDCTSSTNLFVPANTPINRISVRVVSASVADDPYLLCIESMDEAQ